MTFSRRDILRFGLASAGLLTIPRWAQSAGASDEPHFFLKILLNGGADSSYLFDARPLAMTKAGLIQNYLGEEPTPWMGANGGRCLATKLTAPLAAFRSEFSILNGVVMDAGANGHPQNMNYLYTGNSFGGESFIPRLNAEETKAAPTSLDAIQNGSIFASITNTGRIVNIDARSSDALRKKLGGLKPARQGDELLDFVRSRYLANSNGKGLFSHGSNALLEGFNGSADLQAKLLSLPPLKPANDDQQFADLVCTYFRSKIARSAIWVFPEAFDVHDADSAQRQPKMFTRAVDRLALILKTLRETPYDKKRSMLDVTTFMVATEFGRTLRNPDSPIEATGTNHNQLSNSILLGGKGIRGGYVVGASDYQQAGEMLSAAHLSLDADRLQTMGRPFDFATLRVRPDQPEKFDPKDHLTIDSVINSVYSIFGVPDRHYRSLGRNEPVARLLCDLLR